MLASLLLQASLHAFAGVIVGRFCCCFHPDVACVPTVVSSHDIAVIVTVTGVTVVACVIAVACIHSVAGFLAVAGVF
jgi:hypothetical protein